MQIILINRITIQHTLSIHISITINNCKPVNVICLIGRHEVEDTSVSAHGMAMIMEVVTIMHVVTMINGSGHYYARGDND